MKYSEAKQQIKALSEKYSARIDETGDFDVFYQDSLIIYVRPYRYGFGSLTSMSISSPMFEKVYMIMAELAATPVEDRKGNEESYVKAFGGYLNLDYDGVPSICTKWHTDGFETSFTNEEIEELKQRKDIPLDWNKVKLEHVHDL